MWQLQDHVATFVAGPFRIQLNTARPIEGIAIHCDDAEWAIRPLQISAHPPLQDQPEPIDEVYVRGNDLIASYRLASARKFHPELAWTAGVRDALFVVDLTIAIQTELLTSEPSLTSVTTAKNAELLIATGTADKCTFEHATTRRGDACGLFLFRMPQCDFSYAEMVYPADFDALRMTVSDGSLENHMIREPLEKGVIRKAQLRGMIVPRDRDAELAAAGFRSFHASSPPLST
jgi:hypothetical protein